MAAIETVNIADVAPSSGSPFDGMTEDDFLPITDLVGKRILITAAVEFPPTDEKPTPGVYLEFSADGARHYTCTHAAAVVAKMANERVKEALADGKAVAAEVRKRRSKRNPERQVIDLQ